MFNQGTSGKNFQGKEGKSFKVERQEELGLNVDMTKFRMYDYALGRFTSIDPLADANPQESWTPYQYAYNNPIRYNDPYGDCPLCGAVIGAAVDYGTQVAGNLIKGKSFTDALTEDISLSSIAISAGEGFLTSGASVMKKVIVSGIATIVDNTVEVKTSSDGLDVNVETNPGNVVKNVVVDGVSDLTTGGLAPSSKTVKKQLSKVGVNKGEITKKTKKIIKGLDGKVSGNLNMKIKTTSEKFVNGTANTLSTVSESAIKATTNAKKEEIKKKTNN